MNEQEIKKELKVLFDFDENLSLFEIIKIGEKLLDEKKNLIKEIMEEVKKRKEAKQN